jgi:SNF2-related domain
VKTGEFSKAIIGEKYFAADNSRQFPHARAACRLFRGAQRHARRPLPRPQAERAGRHEQTIGERLVADQEVLLPETPFEPCDKRPAKVSSTALVRYRMNDYSVPTTYGFRDVLVKGFVDEVAIICGAREIGWHPRVYGRGQFVFDPKHYLALLEQKPGALDQAAPLQNWTPIFDFLNPGLLGAARQFKRYVKNLAAREHNPYGPLRQLVAPYILRRMKTDRSIIADLPDKTEVKAHCQLSRKQAALYAQAVDSLADDLDSAGGIARKRLVLASLMRLKQICNRPSQWLGDQGWREERQMGASARYRRCDRGASAKDAGLQPVPRDNRPARRVPFQHFRTAWPDAAWRDGGAQAQEPSSAISRRTSASRFSCCR